ncbi:TPA: hypothetical protein NJ584_003261 [Vibrio parahaemolyticus]|nr:hypothetical protein [Vibrio parahaemolyticus]
MSTQESRELIESINDLTQTVAGKMGEIDKKVDEAVKSIPDLHKVFYVDALVGSDTNTGVNSGNPLKTVKEAVDRTPQNGSVEIRLKRNQDHFLTGDARTFIDVDNKTITMNVYGSGDRPVIKMVTGTEVGASGSIAYGFRVPTFCRIVAVNCDIDTMVLHADTTVPWVDYGGFASRSYQEGQVGTIEVVLSSCHIKLRDHQLSSHYNRISYTLLNVEVSHLGAQKSLVGISPTLVAGNTYSISASNLILNDETKTVVDLFNGITESNSLTNLSLVA